MRRWRSLGLKFRLVAWYTVVLVVVLCVNALAILCLLQHLRYADLHNRLQEDMEVTEHMLELGSDGKLMWRAEVGSDDDKDAYYNLVIDVWDRHGVLLMHRDLSGKGRVVDHVPGEIQGAVFSSGRTDRGYPVRMVAWPYVLHDRPLVIRIARSDQPIRRELEQVLLVMVLAFPVAAGVAGVGGYMLADRILAPLNRIIRRAKAISAENLSDRIPVDNPDDELGKLAGVLNDTFSRLERSFDELRRFTSDVSHELRTPLTAIRSVGEVGLRTAGDENDCRNTISSMLEEVDRLSRMVDDLLQLSKADSGAISIERENVNLEELVREVVDYLGVLAEEKDQSLVVQAAQAPEVLVDRSLVRHAVINLVDNAIKYSPRGSIIRLCLKLREGHSVLEVIDQGPGIPEEHRLQVFQRFYRVDKARSMKPRGAGLGLSIAKWIIEAHGGRIELVSHYGRGSVFRIVLPERASPYP